ncbi:MAG: hypothetical protein U0821_08380 [Chloroflexota bacterium]
MIDETTTAALTEETNGVEEWRDVEDPETWTWLLQQWLRNQLLEEPEPDVEHAESRVMDLQQRLRGKLIEQAKEEDDRAGQKSSWRMFRGAARVIGKRAKEKAALSSDSSERAVS